MSYLLLFLPFLIMVVSNVLPKKLRVPVAFWLGIALVVFQTALSLLAPFRIFKVWPTLGLEMFFGFNLMIDNLGLLLVLSSGIVGFASLVMAWSTIKHRDDRFNFINLLLVTIAGMNGIALVRDLFSLYVFIEVIAVATFILIMLFKSKEAYEGALKYLVLSVVASVLMLTSIGMFIMFSGGVSFAAVKMSLVSHGALAKVAIALFVCGLFIKGGMVPFHGWLADAYTGAPAPASMLLAGVITKACGLFTLMRLLTSVFGFGGPLKAVLLVVGTISILIGALAALGQKDMKRMLAYSSISQMGYIVIALGCGTELGLFAAAFHFFNHAVFKSQLFANAAAVEEVTGSRDLDAMGGLAQKMPVTGVTLAIASLSTAGIPPLSGFWSKLLIIVALWSSGNYFYAVVAVLASVLTLAYFLSLQRRAFFGRLAEGVSSAREAGAGVLLPAVFLSFITVMLGIGFPFLLRYFVR